MTKAKLTLSNGTEVQIEGTPSDVRSLLALYTQNDAPDSNTRNQHTDTKKNHSKGAKIKSNQKAGPVDLIRGLVEEKYFNGQKRSISDIQKKLEEGGHIYAQTSLSTPLTRLTRAKELRRLKEKKGWMYVV